MKKKLYNPLLMIILFIISIILVNLNSLLIAYELRNELKNYPRVNSFEVVVARYNEDLSWIAKEFPNDKVTIYNKGKDDLNLPSKYQVIKLDNVGREGHTYLYHIVKNYHHLTDRVLFLQGNPFEHRIFSPLERYKILNQRSASENIISYRLGLIAEKNWEKLHLSPNPLLSKTHQNKYRDTVMNHKYNFYTYAKEFVNVEIPDTTGFYFNLGANFAVDRSKIMCHEVQFYQKILATLETSKSPAEGHYLERLWDKIFVCN